jgi:hypothetical protein
MSSTCCLPLSTLCHRALANNVGAKKQRPDKVHTRDPRETPTRVEVRMTEHVARSMVALQYKSRARARERTRGEGQGGVSHPITFKSSLALEPALTDLRANGLAFEPSTAAAPSTHGRAIAVYPQRLRSDNVAPLPRPPSLPATTLRSRSLACALQQMRPNPLLSSRNFHEISMRASYSESELSDVFTDSPLLSRFL